MDSNKILGIVVILFFTGLSIGVVLFLTKVKEMNVGDKKSVGEVKEVNKPLSKPTSTPSSEPPSPVLKPPAKTPSSLKKSSSSQTSNDPIHDLLPILSKEDDSFAFTRGEDGNLLLICSLKIPFESIKGNEDDNFSNINLRKVIKNAVSQYISIRNPTLKNQEACLSSNFLKLLYTKKESFIGSRINRTFMPDDIFEIVKKTIRGLRGFYKMELIELNSKTVICLLYDLEDKIINFNFIDDNTDDIDSYNTFLSLFFTNDHFDFIQDVRNSLELYEKKKKYLLKFGLENKAVLCAQDDPKMDYDILDFIIYVCSKVLTNTISKRIY